MAVGRHLGFGAVGNRSIRSAVPKIPTHSSTKSVRDIVIWNIKDGGIDDAITDVVRSGSTIRDDHLDNPRCRTLCKDVSLFRQEKKHFENVDRQTDPQTDT